MKKTLLACALLGSLVGTSAQAATVVGFKVGGDYWKADTSGTFAERGRAQQEFNYDSSSQGSIWVAVEHPIPLVPNVKIRQNSLDADGKMSDADFIFNEHNFKGDVNANADLSNTDFVLYYEILDNDIVSLDLGAAYKKMDGHFRVSDAGHPESKNIDSGIVMGYIDAQVGVPGLGLYGFTDIMMGVDESNVYDYSLGLGWNFDGTALDYRIRAGYRDFKFDVNGFDGVTADMQFKGYFAGVELVF
ncbi:TIGR04219 family outer membrane beta-barrel protein [Shewanella fidelis]|uniref:TIGR04219 family outer membrane beta-barrel protein n=1 Tax=Shewanella fidelis TaxID=173509 RepID=A0AAW8NI39_9GAMM|nr:TIGR04219 family outer membrane beta-barrel protein [Shewanella fidelis]MDR8522357.1 TIGR04219 family outer membrane beta-barrel protein [Shewanella fidelis]MDW4812427.1 TIGR04219 family outer membrane beta-barrel protein [Shewanella fidelis]MDW4816174.1 TIGR04219 family outer membrane beta-barrel protein [Shewanella fidelis]MDW4820668.1 TIGR04219 family outer membrane beta-barrel protein [Shewanella fidelis]MDW4824890.1 TIGR04219 family outer membrane beta-barrel protein [Shewanella fideli